MAARPGTGCRPDNAMGGGGDEGDRKSEYTRDKSSRAVTVFGLNPSICVGRDALSREVHCSCLMYLSVIMCSNPSDPSRTEIISTFLWFRM